MASPRRPFLAAVTLLAWLALAAPAAALPRGQDQIVLSGSVYVPRGREVGEVVVLRGSARIDGVALGDVVVVDGPVVVHGQVSGDVIAVDGRVVLGPGAQVGGDVNARGTVSLGAGSKVGGRVRQHVAYAWRGPVEVFGRFASWLAVSASTLLFGLLLVLLAPRGLDAAGEVGRSSPWSAIGWAAGILVGVPVAVLFALASIVALPLALVVALGAALLAFVGYAVSAYAVGRALWAAPGNRAVALLFGWLILRAVGAIPYVSGVTFGLAAAYGLGAVGLAAWRARATAGRHRGGRRTAVPLSPPIGEEAGL